MELKFISIQLHNFASYKDATLDLDGMGYTLVLGKNNCKLDNAYSNGSGKSAIFNGLCYALTGETTLGISSGIENIFSDPDDCWVQLKMVVDGDEFVIKRVKSPKQNLTIFVNGEDRSGKGKRESGRLLTNYIPDLTTDLVNGIIILGQGLPHRFTNNKPSHRKEMLENLTKSDFMIQSIKDKLESRLSELRSELRSKEDIIIGNNSREEVYRRQVSDMMKDLKEYDEYSSSETSIEAVIKTHQEKLADADADLLSLQQELTKLEQRSKTLVNTKTDILGRRDAELRNKLTEVEKGIEEANKSLYERSGEIKSLTREITKLESISDTCPTCGQKIPGAHKPSTEKEKAQLETLKASESELKGIIAMLSEEKAGVVSEHNREYNNLITDADTNILNNNAAIEKIKRDITAVRKSWEVISQEIYRLSNLRDNYNKLISGIEAGNQQIEEITNNTSTLRLEQAEISSRIETVQQMLTLAKREFRGILLQNVISFIDKKVKQYSKEVFGTDKLAFTLNENYLDITYCDKLYENLSGGEKQKIDIIIQLALRDILSKQLGLRSNILVLDEVYDNMDSVSCQKITNLISTLNDIDSIFIISHHIQDLELTYDNQLLVEKGEDGISHLSFI